LRAEQQRGAKGEKDVVAGSRIPRAEEERAPPGVRYAIDLSGPLRRYLTSEYRVILINYTVS
jgi:hypothetical protein